MQGQLTKFVLAAAICGTLLSVSRAADDEQNKTTERPPNISIPDSPGATERFDKAKEKEDRKQWKAAAEFYQEVIEKYSGRVLPAKIDADESIYQYIGATEIVLQRLAKWPDEGLAAYRAAYEPPAADLLAAAGKNDATALSHVFATYPLTEAAKTAGLKLLDLQLESGHDLGGSWVGDRLLLLLPKNDPNRAGIIFRTALARYWAGDTTKAKSLLDDLRQNYPNDTAAIAGKDVLLADALATAIKAPVPSPTTQPNDADNWPSYAGADGSGGISPSIARPGASLNSIPVAPIDYSRIPQASRSTFQLSEQSDLTSGTLLGIIPSSADGVLFFQDGRHVYAVTADSGLPLPGWSQTYPGEQNGRYSIDVFGRPRGDQLTVTVTPNRVLAVVGQSDPNGAILGQVTTASARLVCLDRSNGKQLWARSPSEFPESAAALRTAEFNGTARLFGEDSVLVLARGGKQQQFEDCYLACLSLKTGEYKWSTYVGSASRVFMGEAGGSSGDTSEFSIADGRAFVLTNLGTVAAVDAADGRMIWLSAYPRDASTANGFGNPLFRGRFNPGQQMPGKPWTHNPVLVQDGKVFVLPSDGKALIIYDAGTGAELKRISLADFDDLNTLLAVRGSWIVGTSDKLAFCIDWNAYVHDDPQSSLIWRTKSVDDGDPVFGRGFVTADSVFIPSQKKLYQVSFDSRGLIKSMYPSSGAWASNQGPGNVLVTSQNVIVAGASHVDVYTDLSLVRQQYENMIAAAPQDPVARLRYAEVLFSGAQYREALTKIDEAINLLGGKTEMRAGKERDLVFLTALAFAQKSGAQPSAEIATAADEFYNRAQAAAAAPEQTASYEMSRAKYRLAQHDVPGAVKLYQQVLSDDATRTVALSENSTGGSEAESAIAAIIRTDRTAYGDIEKTAADALATATSQQDAKKLLSIAKIYPNSKAAADARRSAAGLSENAGDHSAAIESLQESYASTTDPVDKARLLEDIARNFAALPDGIGPAIDRMTQATKYSSRLQVSHPIKLPDGTNIAAVSYADAVVALRKFAASRAVAELPDFYITPPPADRHRPASPFGAEAQSIENIAAIIRPAREVSRNDTIITWSPAKLAIYAVGSSTPSFTVENVAEQPRGAAWIGKKLLFWTWSRLSYCDETGKVLWQQSTHDLPKLAVATAGEAVAVEDTPGVDENGNMNGAVIQQRVFVNGRAIIVRNGRAIMPMNLAGQIAQPQANNPAPEAGEQILTVIVAGDRVLVTTSTGRVMCIDSTIGKIAWQSRADDNAINRIAANAHYTVIKIEDANGAQLVVYQTQTGQVIGRRKFGSDNSPTQLVNFALSEEGTLLFTITNKLFAKDLYETWKNLPLELEGSGVGDLMTFTGLAQNDDLIVKEGRVIASYATGKFIRLYDLVGKAQPSEPLATGGNGPVAVRLVGPHLYISNGRTLWHYNATDPNDHFATLAYEVDSPARIRELFLGKDKAILLDDPIDRGPTGSTFVRLLMFRRGPISATNTHESSLLDYYPVIKDAAGILAWQPVEGGLYYLAGDQKLHLLRGGRQ